MGIKHVQHDTLSHFITDRATSFGLFNEALTQLYSAHEIYHSNEAEVGTHREQEMSIQGLKGIEILFSNLNGPTRIVDPRDDFAGIQVLHIL